MRTLPRVSCGVTIGTIFWRQWNSRGDNRLRKERLPSLHEKLHWGGDVNTGIFVGGGFTVCCCFLFLKAKGSCLRNESNGTSELSFGL